MKDPLEALVIDLLEWIGRGSRPYAEVIEAWRTSCPRLPVWEEANARGLLVQVRDGGTTRIALSADGLERLAASRATTGSGAGSPPAGSKPGREDVQAADREAIGVGDRSSAAGQRR